MFCRNVEWREPILCLEINIAACCKKQLSGGRLPKLDCDVEWSAASHVLEKKKD